MPTGEQGGRDPQRVSSANFWLKSVLVIVVVGSLLAWAWRPSRPEELVYEGRTLSEWLRAYVEGDPDTEAYILAKAALEKIGTNGIPTLLRRIETPDSKFRTMMKALLQKQSFFRFNFEDAGDIRFRASYGFLLLAEEAKGAVPELIALVKKPSGTAGREETIWALGQIGPSAQAAVPALLAIASDAADQDRRDAIFSLGLIHSSPESAVPVLASFLHDSDGRVRYDAARSLSKFGEAAKSSAPALITLLADPSPQVREQATNALKLIDPAAATKAGIP